MNFAAVKHKDQRRKDQDGTPYINHPIGVAFILTEEAGIYDVPVLLASILHDTVEDTDTTFDEIEQHFGSHVRKLVEEVRYTTIFNLLTLVLPFCGMFKGSCKHFIELMGVVMGKFLILE